MIVYYGHKTRKSGALLQEHLEDIEGPSINYGYQKQGEINRAEAVALASNKRLAFERFKEAGVPIPEVYSPQQARVIAWEFPLIGRPDKHRAGKQFYFCRTTNGVIRATGKGATHFIEYIEDAREFRVHIVNRKSIKIAEKVGGGVRKNFKRGAEFVYPQDFHHKKSLRKVARKAVMSLGLDFGAVDILYRDDRFYVLEVNTAPSLTSASDSLERYVTAFKREYGQD